MPVTLSMSNDFGRMIDRLDAVALKQLPYATARALTDTAKAAKVEIEGDLPKIFDRPVPFTLNAIGYTPATKLSLSSMVFVKDKQAKFLLPEEQGGERTPGMNVNKPGAKALIVPSKIKLNAYGNIPNGAIGRLFQKLQAAPTPAAKRRVLSKRGLGIAYLQKAGLHGQGPGGLFLRLAGHRIQRLVSFEAMASYKPRFGYVGRVTKTARATFGAALKRRLAEAQASGGAGPS